MAGKVPRHTPQIRERMPKCGRAPLPPYHNEDPDPITPTDRSQHVSVPVRAAIRPPCPAVSPQSTRTFSLRSRTRPPPCIMEGHWELPRRHPLMHSDFSSQPTTIRRPMHCLAGISSQDGGDEVRSRSRRGNRARGTGRGHARLVVCDAIVCSSRPTLHHCQ